MAEAALEGIWVADSNLLRPTYSRRFLLGLAAYTEQPIALVPALMELREVPSAFTYGVGARSRLRESLWLVRGVREGMTDWLRRETDKDELFVMHRLPEGFGREQYWDEMERFFRPNERNEYPHALDIVAETLEVGGDFIATDNFTSVKHHELNTWGRVEHGFNRDMIGGGDALVEHLLGTDEAMVANVIGAMAVSSIAERADMDEFRSIEHFAQRLQSRGWMETSLAVESHLDRLDEQGLEELLSASRALSRTPRFATARHAEEALQGIYADCLESARQLGHVGELSATEVRFIEKYGDDRTGGHVGH